MSEPVGDGANGRLRVLVVEDEALVMMSVVDMLEELGHEAVEAANGTAALSLVSDGGHIDAMLTDINLPDIRGQELAEKVRGLRPALPIVFATGYRMDIPEAIAGTGPTAVLGKPYWTAELEKALRQVL